MTRKKKQSNFYTEQPVRLMIFSFFSVGVYNIYYFFKNFSKNDETSSFLTLIGKSILYPFFCFDLLKKANISSGKDRKAGFKGLLLWILLFIFVYAGGVMPGNLKYLAFATFVPLLGINHLFERANTRK